MACSGATTDNVMRTGQCDERPQIEAVAPNNPNVVLVSIGGNNVKFADMVTCAFISQSDCAGTPLMTDAEARISVAAVEVRRLLEEVVRLAPQATVALAGYPQLMQGVCGGFSAAEAARFDVLSRKVRIAWTGEVMAMRMQGKKGVRRVQRRGGSASSTRSIRSRAMAFAAQCRGSTR